MLESIMSNYVWHESVGCVGKERIHLLSDKRLRLELPQSLGMVVDLQGTQKH